MYVFYKCGGECVRPKVRSLFLRGESRTSTFHDLVDESNQKFRRQRNVICMLLPSFVQSTKILLNVLELLYK